MRVRRLVGAHGEDQIAHRRALAQLPVRDADRRRRRVDPQAAGVDAAQGVTVRFNGLLLEISDAAVAKLLVWGVGRAVGQGAASGRGVGVGSVSGVG